MAIGTETLGERGLPRLSWGAVIAGVLLALALHVVLGLVGAALGFAAEPADSRGVGAAAAIWALLTPFVATLAGAWLASRLANRWDTAGSNLHGVMVWCIGLLAGAIFLAGTLASGAMTAGTAASGNAGALQRFTGASRSDVQGPRAQAQGERAADDAGKAGAAATGGAAMAALCGLLGAFAGAGIARARREGKRGQMALGGWQIVRREQQRADGSRVQEEHRAEERPLYGERTYAPPSMAERTMETSRDVTRTEAPSSATTPPSDPYHH